MKPLILLVEDDPNIVKYIKMTLEFNQCEVITAENGKVGLKVLSEQTECPDLIISDILMPELDGYDFYNEISNNPALCHIPFVFLSALDSAEEIRMGKMLGADDYLTKPINEDDLMATVFGKIKRSMHTKLFNKRFNELFALDEIETESITDEYRDLIILIEVQWDDRIGPKLVNQFPKDIKVEFSLDEISEMLFDGLKAMYGQDYVVEAEGILVPVKKFNVMAYAFFDSYPDNAYRGGEKEYMLSVISSRITYFQSLKIKEVLMEISSKYKKQEEWDFKEFWEDFSDILLKPIL
ncbi:MAG: response regulator [Promethearchaeota archaeon]|nr:MAG: response regulator [Candidatus Lokiarchaeota archaeon]